MRALIVTADDFGLTEGVNKAIREAHETGVLAATTALANGDAIGEVAQLRHDLPELDVGVHVNLTLGRPSAEPARVRTLLDAEGNFLPFGALFKRALRGKVRPDEIRREVEAQIAAVRRHGVDLTHWDAHQQAAFGPRIVSACASAAHAAGLRRARSPRALPQPATLGVRWARWRWRMQRPPRLATDAHREWAHRFALRRFTTPDWQLAPSLVDGARDYDERWSLLFARLPTGVSEAVSHPGYVSDSLRRLTPGLVDERSRDLAALCDPALPERLQAAGIRLTRFRDLA